MTFEEPGATAPDGERRMSSSSSSSSGGSRPTEAEAGDSISLTFLTPDSQRYTMGFRVGDSVQHVKQGLLKQWPGEFGTCPASLLDIRLLYAGSFLDNDSTLDAVKRHPDAPTVVHLMKSSGKTPEKEGTKDTGGAPKCTCIIL